MPNTYTLKPPVVDTIFYACGCLSKDDQTIYCAIHRSLRVPESDPVTAPKPSRVSERLYEEADWCRETGLHYTAALLTEAADLLEKRA